MEQVRLEKKFKMIHNAFEEKNNRRLMQYNLTSAQMDILIYLKHNEGRKIHQRELEKWLRMKNPTVTGILNRLEEKEFIVRKVNPEDKRFRLIELTEKSTCIMEEMCSHMQEMDAWMNSCMTEEEQKQLAEYLDRILSRLSEI